MSRHASMVAVIMLIAALLVFGVREITTQPLQICAPDLFPC